MKKASQVIYLHFALRKRAIIEELHEKQEQVSSLFAFTNMRRFCAFFISSCYEYNNANFLRVLLSHSQILCQKVKEWLHHIGIGEQTAVIHDDAEPDDGAVQIYSEDSIRNRCQKVSV